MYIYNGKITSTFGTSGSGHCLITGDTIQKNLWYQFIYTYNDSSKTCKLFKNGQLVDSINNWLTIPANSDVNLGIGKRDDIDDGYFNGIIDEIRIYNRALSADEIKAHYNEVINEVMRVHNINKGTDYTTIQAAINDSNPGDEIQVDSGTYFENVNVNKQLTLRGIGMPVVDAGGSGSTITLAADGIRLEGFTANGGGMFEAGIHVLSSNNILSGNKASSNTGAHGILLSSSNNNTLNGNNASNNHYFEQYATGIFLDSSSNNTLSSNNALNNGNGIYLYSSNSNMLNGNNITNIYDGIYLRYSSNNTLSGNKATNNLAGIELEGSSSNLIYNNFFDNTYNAQFSDSTTNRWNITKKSGTNIIGGAFLGGNFWSDSI